MIGLIGQQLGNYRLIRLLGQGGFAEVYLAEHTYLKTQAAVKVLAGKMTPQELQDFSTEAQTIAKLKHPHIVRILDFGVENNLPFLVMDYAPNGTLRDRHPQGAILPLPTILPYVKQAAAALQYAHDQQLVHRDVKPENMLIDANNDILLSDFGIAVIAHRTQSLSTQEAIGTVTYMAPEQIKGKARPASDQYSLAIVVYEWLSGICPFDGLSSIEIAMKHLSDSPPPFPKNLKISPQVEQVVLKALAKDPHQRFASIQEFVAALEQAQKQQPVRIVPEPPPVPKSPLFPAVNVVIPAKISQPVGTTLLIYQGHSNEVRHVVWSPNSTYIASASDDNTVQVWDATSGRTLLTYQGHTGHITTLAWSPNGQYIASGSGDKTVQIWEAATGQTTFTYRGHAEDIASIAWSPDGKWIASGGGDKTVQVWDSTNGKLILTYRGHSFDVRSVKWSPQGKHIASIEERSNKVQIWEAATGQTIVSYVSHCHGKDDAPRDIAWSPDGKYIVSAHEIAQISDTKTGKPIILYTKHAEYITTLAWSPNGQYIASGSGDKTVQIWEAATGQTTFTYRGHAEDIASIAWSPDGTRIASTCAYIFGGKCKTVHVWQAVPLQATFSLTSHVRPTISPEAGKTLLTYNCNYGEFCSIKWSYDGLLASVVQPDKNSVLVRNISTASNICTYDDNPVTSIAWSPDCRRIASFRSANHNIHNIVDIWDAITGHAIFTHRSLIEGISTVVWSPDSRLIAFGAGKTVQVFDASNGFKVNRVVASYRGHTQKGFIRVKWSPDGTWIASSSSSDNTVHVWNATTGKCLTVYSHNSKWHVEDILWSPDSTSIASREYLSEKTYVWDAKTGRPNSICQGKLGSLVAWSPDGTRIASAGDDKTVQIWNVHTGTIITSLNCHHAPTIMEWSPTGSRIATVGKYRQMIQIWDAESGNCIACYNGHVADIYTLQWSSDGICIASQSNDIQIWRVT